ncbi:MAG: Aspartyl/glutamyl-tRNA(Asn/Gln) amidotransferase subunit C [Atribacteria bacterium 34_868]|nr:MAG: Aspartyl/glutamyl-tRNA(Asn/Gln) amidotransferase subunit C [Atribacteria bacterium 34_868]MDD3538670.1 Asp-tRNA(Asn)/Glu-tRNA(Gln) amidotransferase subunit GatC [Atribacterota bacterium]MDD5497034.1 Asp-tRNA(Asn)/Glu-tRNA(Gln) amidotransferase subunit GatC [Atribacterota bacterium]
MTEKIITKKEVEYVAKLAKLELSEEQKELFSKQLNDILSFFAKLKELDTEQIEPAFHSHITHSTNHFHEDIPKPSLAQEVVLNLTEHKQDGYIQVPKIL